MRLNGLQSNESNEMRQKAEIVSVPNFVNCAERSLNTKNQIADWKLQKTKKKKDKSLNESNNDDDGFCRNGKKR